MTSGGLYRTIALDMGVEAATVAFISTGIVGSISRKPSTSGDGGEVLGAEDTGGDGGGETVKGRENLS